MSRWALSDAGRCDAACYHRDTYRHTGHGPTGFTMHYSRERCTRAALPGTTKCWQHDPDLITGRYQRAHEKRMAKWRRKVAHEKAHREAHRAQAQKETES